MRRAAAAKLDRAPTLVVCSVVRSDDPVEREEDRDAAAVAAYIVLLGAHARGLAGYWRTPGVLRDEGRAAKPSDCPAARTSSACSTSAARGSPPRLRSANRPAATSPS